MKEWDLGALRKVGFTLIRLVHIGPYNTVETYPSVSCQSLSFLVLLLKCERFITVLTQARYWTLSDPCEFNPHAMFL